ncbi:MAG: co-chaperone GroES [Phycisphaeraceae bacterium]|nr:co-chaperone GroES [Phycisphaeraceae bacterium]
MKISPLDDRVLIKPAEAQEKTANGLYLPDSAREKPMQGKVVAVGPGKLDDNGKRTTPSVKKGDTVIYGKYAGTDVQIDGQDHKILKESELLGVVEK